MVGRVPNSHTGGTPSAPGWPPQLRQVSPKPDQPRGSASSVGIAGFGRTMLPRARRAASGASGASTYSGAGGGSGPSGGAARRDVRGGAAPPLRRAPAAAARRVETAPTAETGSSP